MVCVSFIFFVALFRFHECSQARPNVILMVADDLGFNDVGFSEAPSHTLTPNLDKLARAGTVLRNHYVQQFCSPTRACLMTGRYVLRYGLQNNVISPPEPYAIPRGEHFVSQNFKDAGYATAQFGKWHLGFYDSWAVPTARGFDQQLGYYSGAEDYFTHQRDGGYDWHRNGTSYFADNGTYSEELLAVQMVNFISQRESDPATPWFVYLPWQNVHSPLQVPDRYKRVYSNLTGNQLTRAAMVSAMDVGVGAIAAALSKSSFANNTLIVFTADNGAPYAAAVDQEAPPDAVHRRHRERPPAGRYGLGGGSNYPLTGWKHYIFDGGVRSAAFVWGPGLGVPAGAINRELMHAVDWLPTFAAMAGLPTARNLPLDGINQWGTITGGEHSRRTEVPVNIGACGNNVSWPSALFGPNAAMVVLMTNSTGHTNQWKLIADCWWRKDKVNDSSNLQLYNLSDDPAEEHDLFSSSPGVVALIIDRLNFYERQSTVPYQNGLVDPHCAVGKPQGNPPAWEPWCFRSSSL